MMPSYPPETKKPTPYKLKLTRPFGNASKHVIQQLWWIIFSGNAKFSESVNFHSRIALSYIPLQHRRVLDLQKP